MDIATNGITISRNYRIIIICIVGLYYGVLSETVEFSLVVHVLLAVSRNKENKTLFSRKISLSLFLMHFFLLSL